MSQARLHRVANQIKKEISHIVNNEIKDPRISPAITSITGVQVSRDFSHAWVYISVFDHNISRSKDILKVLEKAAGFVRSEVGKRIRLRHVPEIHFVLDESIGYGAHIDQVLKDVLSDRDDDRAGDKNLKLGDSENEPDY